MEHPTNNNTADKKTKREKIKNPKDDVFCSKNSRRGI